jgi:hypothetical protein
MTVARVLGVPLPPPVLPVSVLPPLVSVQVLLLLLVWHQ